MPAPIPVNAPCRDCQGPRRASPKWRSYMRGRCAACFAKRYYPEALPVRARVKRRSPRARCLPEYVMTPFTVAATGYAGAPCVACGARTTVGGQCVSCGVSNATRRAPSAVNEYVGQPRPDCFERMAPRRSA